MANLIRSAKSGNDWTENDLEAYNIQLQFEDAATFFGDSIRWSPGPMPLPEIDEEILTTLDADDMLYDSNAELINLLDLAMGFSEEPAVNDFAVELFKRLGYVKRNRVARTQKDISFFNSGRMEEDKRSLPDELRDPRPQLIAEAIAAFDRNNHLQRYAEEQTIESKAFGTMPTFFKIPVTSNLVRHVQYGTYPPEPTVVSIHVPDLPRPRNRYKEGMRPLDNREALLRNYEAFKRIVGIRQKD
ncbi:hypothetical protein F5888DRAFT_1910452 [Russula emetica]|nr:hypothetical protein F5888DRAFT_1910452 [Russula emetica]